MKRVRLRKITTLILILLFCSISVFAIYLTNKFIAPSVYGEEKQEDETEEEQEEEKDMDESQVGATSGNLLQHYDNASFGLLDANNEYIFKLQIINNTQCITQQPFDGGQESIAISGITAKNLNIVGDSLYMTEKKSENDTEYELIAKMNISDKTFEPINTTKAGSITSFVSDGENIYYTVGEDFFIYKVDSDDAITKMYKSNEKAEHPHILGINSGYLYYINGTELCKLGLHSYTNKVISTQYCSIDQYPIVTDDGIYAFSTLNRTQLDLIDFNGEYITTLHTFQKKVESINYSCGYVFALENSKIYYINKSHEIEELEDISPKTNTFYLTDKYLIFENTENGQPVCEDISWILNQ